MTPPASQLPHAERARVPVAKLRDYVLNPAHPQGGSKARVFAAVLGITQNDWRYLHDQLLAGVLIAPAIPRAATVWGQLYEVTVEVTGPNGAVHRVRTGWILRTGEDRPQLTTAYVDLG